LLQLRKYCHDAGGPGALAALVGIPTNPGPGTDWNAFEEFCKQWEVVSRLFPHCDSQTILGRYLRPSVSERSQDTFDMFSRVDVEVSLTHVTIEAVEGQITANLASDRFDTGQVYYSAASNNPGFDYFYLEQTPAGQYVIVCGECKMSGPLSSTTLNENMIQAKLKKVEEALALSDPTGKLKQRPVARVYVFFMAMRNVTESALNAIHLAGPSDLIVGVVLDRDRLRRLFGPSLFARPEFFADYVDRGAAAAMSQVDEMDE